jgi:thiol-disulfide isomerase/thioredoxin
MTRAVAAAWIAAVIAMIGAALLWLRPWQPVAVETTGGAAVIGAPETPFPKTVVRPGQYRGQVFAPAPAPAFTLTVLSAGVAPRPGSAGPQPAPAGRAPVLIPPPGGRLALAALRGHPVVINFWASWCAPCRAEMPMLVRAAHAYAGRGIIVLGMDVDDAPTDARRFLALYRVDYPIVIVPNDRLSRAYGVIGLPTTVFVDAAGVIRARQLGQFDGAAGEHALARELDALITGRGR